MKRQPIRIAKHHRARRGAATVELAICLPVLCGLIFGAIEACGMIYTTQSLEIAAYESCRMAIRETAYQRQPGQPNVMTNAQVIAHAEDVLEERGIVGATVEISSDDLTSVAGGAVVTVRITAPALANSLMPGWFWDDVQITAQAAMVKERTTSSGT
ncbi:MAG: pilus assembly protein [Planctomycetales bacterium]|nr:pilus assembly protein [Planctomycetales bacterium]